MRRAAATAGPDICPDQERHTLGQEQSGLGQPVPWQMGFQEAVTPVMERINDFHNLLITISILIVIFVVVLLGYVMFRFRASRNPVPSRTTHNTLLEMIWTVIPALILVVIAVPSFRVLYYMDRAADAEMTIKAIGSQWFWTYEYPDHGNFVFNSLMVPDDEIGEGQVRLLETDTRVVVPVDTTIRLLVTANDVIHAWAIPSFGIKLDAVPGRINETWFRVEREGVFYGQCSELCGINHGFMPIVVEAVSKERFNEWVEEAREEFAGRRDEDESGETFVAAARRSATTQ